MTIRQARRHRERLGDIEYTKLEIEKERLQIQLRQVRWTAVATVIPLIVALVGVAIAFEQLRTQAAAQFRLKAAELVVNSSDPNAADEKAQVLEELFPEYLGKTWAKDLHLNDFDHSTIDDRITFALREYDKPSDNARLAALWLAIFPKEGRFANALR